MKRYLLTKLLIIFVFVFSILACELTGSNPTSVPPRPPDTRPSSGGSSGGNVQPAGQPDLTLSNVTILGVDSQQGSPYYRFQGIVSNSGSADASGFEAGCTYSCPGGLVLTGGFSLVQGGFVGANNSFTYTQSNRISCEPVPAILQNVSCSVDSNNDVVESNENNNSFNPGGLNVPFN